MSKNKIIIIIFIVFTFNLNAQEKFLTKKEFYQDMDTLKNALKAVTIYPYRTYSEKDFNSDFRTIKNRINKKNGAITNFLFYKEIQSLIVKLNDGHTELSIYSLFQENDYYVFPFIMTSIDNKLYIKQVKSNYPVKEHIEGQAIKSINNHKSEAVIEVLNKYNSGEQMATRVDLGLYYFNYFFNLFYLERDIVNIELEDSRVVKFKLIKNKDWVTKKTNNNKILPANYSYQLLNNVAVLKITNFYNLEDFVPFLENFFLEINSKNIKNLVIDLRDNGGGDSAIGDEILKYLYGKPFTQYAKTLIKYSQISKESFKNIDGIDKDYLKHYLSKKNGTIDVIEKYNDLVVPYAKDKRFSGQSYLLINALTYSSATDFAQAFKYYNLGDIIGQNTGGEIISPGEAVDFILPATKIKVQLSSSIDFNIGAKENDFIPVIPTILLDKEVESLNYTLKNIIQ